MTDRLRRLDALFAEKVLGYTTEHFAVLHGGIADDGWALTDRPGKGDILLPYPRPLLRYTRSLDAAWEGAMFLAKQGPPEVSFSAVRWSGASDLAFHATVKNKPASADHPAEALVLACLRAVGVTEEEMG